VVDIYIDELLPKYFHEKEFLKQLDRILQHDGVLFFNKVVNNAKEKIEFEALVSNIEKIFGHSLTYKLTMFGTNNYMLIVDRKIAVDNHSLIMNSNRDFFYNKQFTPSLNYKIINGRA